MVSTSGTAAWTTLNHGWLEPTRTWLADLDGDGKDDVFTYRPEDHGWLVSVAGTSAWSVINHGVLDASQTRFGDLDGDGKDDVFTRHSDGLWRVSYGGTSGWVWINSGSFDPTNTWIGDLDGDGEGDILAINADHSWAVSYGGTSAWQVVNNGVLNPRNTQLVDVNGDGEDDVYTVTDDGQWRVSFSGTGAWQTVNNGFLDPMRTWLADMNGDGTVDVFSVQDGVQWVVSDSAIGAWRVINNGVLPSETPANIPPPGQDESNASSATQDPMDIPASSDLLSRSLPSTGGGSLKAGGDGTLLASSPGYPPWPGCRTWDSTDDMYKAVLTFNRTAHWRSVGLYATMRCGLYEDRPGARAFGYRHISEGHAEGFSRMAAPIGKGWRDVAQFTMTNTLKNADIITYSPIRYCFEKTFTFVNQQGEVTASVPVVVILGETGRRVMTAFPFDEQEDVDESYCLRPENSRSGVIRGG